MLFDWAAQPFFTVDHHLHLRPLFRFPADRAIRCYGQAMWGYTLTRLRHHHRHPLPILGSIADATGPRKPWIAFFAIIKIAALCDALVRRPRLSRSSYAVHLHGAGHRRRRILHRLQRSDDAETGATSRRSAGFPTSPGGSAISAATIVLIAVVALLAANPETGKTVLGIDPLFGLDPANGEDARITGPISALWYLVFILPMFLFTPDATSASACSAGAAGAAGCAN